MDGKRNGLSTIYRANGDREEFTWVDGKRHGPSTIYRVNGDREEFTWINNELVDFIIKHYVNEIWNNSQRLTVRKLIGKLV